MNRTDESAARDALMADIRAVMTDTDRLLHALGDSGGQQATELRARLSQNLREARARLDALQGDVARRTAAATHEAEDYLRRHPWQAAGIAAGLGLLAGLALRRR